MTHRHDHPGGAESSHSSELIVTSAEVAETPRYPSLWRNRDFLLLWSGQLLSSVGSQVSLLVLGMTHSATQAGLIGALDSLPFALLCLPAGALIDRWDRKRVMLICDTGRALALGSIPVVLWLGRLGLLQLCLVALVEGTLMTFFSVAEIASLPHVVSKEQIPAASAQNQVITSASWTLGPFLGGLLYGIGQAVPFLTDAISYICSVLSVFLMRTRFQEERAAPPRAIWHEIGEGLLWLWREHVLRFLALLTLLLVFSTVGFTLILIVLAQNLHATPLAIGMLFASGGVGSMAGAVLSGPLQKRFAVGPLTIGSAWVWAVSWLTLAVAPNLWVLGVANAVSGSGQNGNDVIQYQNQLVQKEVAWSRLRSSACIVKVRNSCAMDGRPTGNRNISAEHVIGKAGTIPLPMPIQRNAEKRFSARMKNAAVYVDWSGPLACPVRR